MKIPTFPVHGSQVLHEGHRNQRAEGRLAPTPFGQEAQPAAADKSQPSIESLTIKCAAELEILHLGGAHCWVKCQRFGFTDLRLNQL
jgi:hypothetical protein